MKKPTPQTLAKWLVGCLGIVPIGLVIYLLPLGRELSVTLLGKLGPVATPLLRHALDDENNQVRWAAHDALVALGPTAVPSLVQALHDKNPRARAEAADALSAIGSNAKDALPDLITAFKDPDEGVRVKAMWALRFIVDTPEEARPPLLALLPIIRDDPNGHIRAKAVEAASILGCHGTAKQVSPVLLQSLKDPHAEVRQEAAEGLGRLGRNRLLPAEAIPALKEALSDPDRSVRDQAREVLENYRTPDVISGHNE
jgi:HEAT repeat protein